MNIKEAKHYIGFGIKEGYYDTEQFEGWSDKQLIEFAEREGKRGNAAIDYPNMFEEDRN